MKKAILLSCLIWLASPAFAADWLLVARASDLSTVSVDRESIEYDSSRKIVTAWSELSGVPNLKHRGQDVGSQKVREQYNCLKKQAKIMYMIYYNPSGELINSLNFSDTELGYESAMKPIVPDTIGAAMLKAVCTNPPQVISRYEQPDDAAQAAYESAAASAFAATVAAFLAQPENQIFKEGPTEYNVLNDQVIYLQTNQPDLDSVTLLEKARKATAAIIDLPPVPERRSTPRETTRPKIRPAPQRQRTPESRPIVNRL